MADRIVTYAVSKRSSSAAADWHYLPSYRVAGSKLLWGKLKNAIGQLQPVESGMDGIGEARFTTITGLRTGRYNKLHDTLTVLGAALPVQGNGIGARYLQHTQRHSYFEGGRCRSP